MSYWLNKKLYKLSWYWYVLLAHLMLGLNATLMNIIFLLITNTTNTLKNPFLEQYSFLQAIFLIVIFAPILETLIFQSFIFNVLLFLKAGQYIKILNTKFNLIYVILSSFIFGILHTYSFGYIIVATIMGYIFAYSYLLYAKKKQYPILMTTLIHSLNNLMAVLLAYTGK